MTNPSPPDPRARYFEQQLHDIDLEIVRQAMLCGIPLESRDQIRAVLAKVLDKDSTVCTKQNPVAFDKLRAGIAMHMSVRERAFESMGRAETMKLLDDVAARLAKRVGFKAE